MRNRERLVRSAAGLFHRQGYAATSVEDLLSDTGIARSNFYYHFDSKLDLAREILGRWAEQYHRVLDDAWEEAGSPGERLRVMFALMDGRGEEAEGLLACPLGALALELAPHDPEIQETLRELFDRLQERLDEVLAQGATRSDLEGGATPGPFVALATLVGALMMCHAFRDHEAFDRVSEGLRELVADAAPADDGAADDGANPNDDGSRRRPAFSVPANGQD
jgi:TetR/AcrR family transcriptional repressor of nem operon